MSNELPVDLPDKARAAVLTAYNEPLELVEVPIPNRIEPGALLVQIETATMCGSDIHLWRGEVQEGVAVAAPKLPAILGHEMVGRIVRFGDGPRVDSLGTPLQIGDRVVWTHGTCGSCFFCNVLREPSLCSNRRLYMWSGCTEFPYLTGGFAEYGYVFPDAGRVRVPDGVKSEWASGSSCALRTVIQGFERLGRVEPWETVVVQGAGPLGLYATAVARRAGAGQIIVIGAPRSRLDVASAWGATSVLDLDEVPDPGERTEAVRRLTGGRGADIVMEFSGGRTAFSEGLDMARRGGRYVIVGQVIAEDVPVRTALITMKQLNVIGSWSGSTGQYWRALEFIDRTKDDTDYDLLTSGRYHLEDVNVAFERMARFEELKPVVVPGAGS